MKLLFHCNSNVLLVGDPRQVTYLTHHEQKYRQYNNGRVKDFILQECNKKETICEIDEVTLKKSHRNNKTICDFSSRLYPSLEVTAPCECNICRDEQTDHEGIFLVHTSDAEEYLKKYRPVQLRYNKEQPVAEEYSVHNYGESKGLTFERVLIYPTHAIKTYLRDGKLTKIKKDKESDAFKISKFYVALTRARFSVGIVMDYKNHEKFIDDIKLYAFLEKKKHENIIRQPQMNFLDLLGTV